MLNGTKRKQQHPRCGKLYTSHNPVFQQPRDKLQRRTVRDTHTHTQSQKDTDRQRALDWEKHPELAPLVVFLFQEMGAPFSQFWEKSPLLPPPPAPCQWRPRAPPSVIIQNLGTPHPVPTTAMVQAWAPHLHIPQWPLTSPLFLTLSLHVYLQQTAMLRFQVQVSFWHSCESLHGIWSYSQSPFLRVAKGRWRSGSSLQPYCLFLWLWSQGPPLCSSNRLGRLLLGDSHWGLSCIYSHLCSDPLLLQLWAPLIMFPSWSPTPTTAALHLPAQLFFYP